MRAFRVGLVVSLVCTGALCALGCGSSGDSSAPSTPGVDKLDGGSQNDASLSPDGSELDSSWDPDSSSQHDGQSLGDSASGSDGPTEVSFGYDAPDYDGTLNADSACAAESAQASKRPVDIIFVIDNSGSMTDEIESVQNNINQNFASIIQSSGVDYRVIMLSKHGKADPDESICVSAPLSGTNCSPVPSQPVNNPPIFFHYSQEIDSHNSLCQVLRTFNTADSLHLAPNGWSGWVRPEAFKVFVEMTDDGVVCSYNGVSYDDNDNIASGETVADRFDQALLALSPEHFGTADERNYMWYSIVCLAANNPSTAPWQPSDPMNASKCSSDNCPAPGTGYQALSRKTGGLRFPLCEYGAFDVVFRAIAEGVVSRLACQFPMPTSEAGIVNPDSVSLGFTPGGGSQETWTQVPDQASCSGRQWYYDNPASPSTIYLCPQACDAAKADAAGKIEILLGCLGS